MEDNTKKSSNELCDEISGELRDIATWLSSGQLDPDKFRRAVLALEDAKVRRYGFTLTGENSSPGRTHFELRFRDTDKLCASMDFDSASQRLSVDHICG